MKNRLILFILVIGLIALLTGCSNSSTDTIASYRLTITVEPEGAGTVVKEPDQSTYRKGTEVTLTATPNQGYTFTQWKGDLTDTTNPVIVIMEQDINIIASFTEETVNQSPVIEQLADQQTEEESALNFTLTASDPDGDTLTYTASGDSAPSSGSLAQYFDPATQTFNWTPARGEAGSYTLTIQVSDGQITVEESVTISVGINFTDPVLEQHVRNTINKTDGLIMPADVNSLQSFTATGGTSYVDEEPEIYTLDGMEYFTGLQDLTLSTNHISDLTPLTVLTNLLQLNLRTNNIQNLSPLTSLINLESLNLYNNQISDLSPLANLTNLKTLYLGANNFSDLSPLSTLNQLVELNIYYCSSLDDLSPMADFNLPNLRILNISSTSISDISSLTSIDLSSLEELIIYDNNISEITALSNPSLSNLQKVNLNHNSISNIDPLTDLSGLTEVFIQYNGLDISAGSAAELVIQQLESRVPPVTVYYDPQE